MKGYVILTPIILAIPFGLILAGCGSSTPTVETEAESSSPVPAQTSLSATTSPQEEVAAPPTPTLEGPTEEPSPEISPTESTESLSKMPESCADEVCTYPGLFLLARPVGPDGRRTIDHTSRFGNFRKGTEAIRGVYFLNSTGTPVLASADGVVVVAGDDSQIPYGRYRGAYGNLVIVEHDLPGIPGPVFTLYAHLSELSVDVDDQVEGGQEIGLVGSTGDISGSSLYYEVRYGENAYQAARNPELWLNPLPDSAVGALAGRIVDSDGNYITVPNVILEQLAGPGQPAIDQFYLRTYAGESLIGLEPWEENFAIGGLPAGEYQISFLMNGMQQRVVEVNPDKVTLVTMRVK